MTILHQLDELRTGLPGTEVVAYVDLSAGMVLGWSSAMVQPQEWLDALCLTASEILGRCRGRYRRGDQAERNGRDGAVAGAGCAGRGAVHRRCAGYRS